MSSRLSEALGVDPAVNLPGALQPGQVTDEDLARLQAFAAAGQQPAQAAGGLFTGERAALAAIPAPQTPFSLMGMAKGAGTGMLDLMELGQTATRPEDIPPSAALAVPALGGMFGAAFAPRGALAAGAASRAVRKTRLPKVKPLADDAASRLKRGEEAGFFMNMPLFHGTDRAFMGFDPRQAGRVTGTDTAQLGVWTARDPAVANEFAKLAVQKGTGNGQQIIPLVHRANKPAVVRLQGDETRAEVAATVRQAWDDNFDAVLIKDFNTGTGKSEILVVKDPSQLRSPHARFDPAQAGSADLLAANPAPAALPGILGQTSTPEQDRLGLVDFLNARTVPQQDRAAILRGDLL